ncbi:MAG: hypothetical protein PHT33_09400, partial [bacterium]|nr:hypothetical protein [bacterium]
KNLWQPAPTRQLRGGALVYPLNTDDLLLNYGNEKGIWSTEVAILQMYNLPESMVDEHINKLTEHVLYSGSPVGMVSLIAENSWDWQRLAGAYDEQASHAAKLQREGKAQSATVSKFAHWYADSYPEVSPSQVWYQPGGWHGVSADDTGILACTRHYRVRLRAERNGGLKLTDLRAYAENLQDPYWDEISRDKFAIWVVPFLLDGSRYRLNGNGETTLTDIPTNQPMCFMPVAIPYKDCPAHGKLSEVDEKSFLWEESDLVAEWSFNDDEILVKVKPCGSASQAGLQLVCNPQVLDMAMVLDGKTVFLSKLLPGIYNSSRLAIVNSSEECVGVTMNILGQGKKEIFCCKWERESKRPVCRLTISNASRPELCLRLRLTECGKDQRQITV